MRVLVVDDYMDTALTLVKLLEISGHDVRMAADGFQALEVARQWQPHCVLLDIGMPGMDGYQLAKRLRNEAGLSKARIVAFSGYTKDVSRFEDSGIDHYLIKPVSLANLREVLDGKPPAPPQ